ncbi:hypothetical protein HOLleu_41093 [Holothuria leucospilota]|uniref:Uncharacterized protein n=1 Tax=Holothuria leucospilota TaxID=206669 RepID=A0A9Q0YB50_HOLLE|nr:hypothetical protein HOLleu_41093 [Holothuria leucospilota]
MTSLSLCFLKIKDPCEHTCLTSITLILIHSINKRMLHGNETCRVTRRAIIGHSNCLCKHLLKAFKLSVS